MNAFLRFTVLSIIPCISIATIIVLFLMVNKEKRKKEIKINLRSTKPFVVKKTVVETISFLLCSFPLLPFFIWSILEKYDLWVILGFAVFVIVPLFPFCYSLFFRIKVAPEKDYIETVIFGIKRKVYYSDMLYYKELPRMGYMIKLQKRRIFFSYMDLFADNLIYRLNCNKVKLIKYFK